MRTIITGAIVLLIAILATIALFLHGNKETNQELDEFHRVNSEVNAKMAGRIAYNISCADADGQTVQLSSLVEKKPVLIFRYSNLNCNTCVESEFEHLNQIFDNHGDDPVVILCSYHRERDFQIFKRINQIEFRIYQIPHDGFDWIAEHFDSPYYFILNSGMTVSDILIPNKEYPDISKQYLVGVKQRLSGGHD